MKILMFGWEFPPFNSGGLGVACYGLTKALAKLGNEIIFVLPKKLDAKSDFMKILYADLGDINIKFYTFPSNVTPYLTSAKYSKIVFGNKEFWCAENLLQEVLLYGQFAKEIAKKEDFDIIHAHDWLSFVAGVEAQKVSGKPLVTHVHATEFDRCAGDNINNDVYTIEHEGLHSANKVIAVSNFTKDILVSKYGVVDSKVEVVHNGVDLSEFKNINEVETSLLKYKKAGYKIILYMGRITIQKGPDYFIRAAAKVLQYNPKLIFVMAGAGDMEHQIIRLASELGISDKVLFPGFVRGDDRLKLYKSADLFVLPSISEPFGIVPLEALANNTPVLISKQSGVSEVLRHVLKTDFWDVDEMANKIYAVTSHSSLKKVLSDNGSEEVKGITWDEAAQKVTRVYDSLTKN